MVTELKASDKETNQAKQELTIQRLYVKKSNFDIPNAPDIFKVDWKPSVEFELKTNHGLLEENLYQVVLGIKVTAKLDEKVAFISDVEQACIFTIQGFNETELKALLNNHCLTILFPYARHEITNAVVAGGFPSFYLAPMNFEAIYQQYLQQQASQVPNVAETIN